MKSDKTKVCRTCKEPKGIASFYHHWGSCISCTGKKRAEAHAQNPIRVLLTAARARAKRDGLPFNLTDKDISIPDRCPILGITIAVKTGSRGASHNSPSLDKIVPLLGYVRGNGQVISNRANVLKSDATMQELILLGQWAKRQVSDILSK